MDKGYLRIVCALARLLVDETDSEVCETFEFVAYVFNSITDVVQAWSPRLEEFTEGRIRPEGAQQFDLCPACAQKC